MKIARPLQLVSPRRPPGGPPALRHLTACDVQAVPAGLAAAKGYDGSIGLEYEPTRPTPGALAALLRAQDASISSRL